MQGKDITNPNPNTNPKRKPEPEPEPMDYGLRSIYFRYSLDNCVGLVLLLLLGFGLCDTNSAS